MNIKKIFTSAVLIGLVTQITYSKPPRHPGGDIIVNDWEVNVREMDPVVKEKITETMGKLKGTEEDRGILADIFQSVLTGGVSGIVDAVVSETYNLAQYRKKQKQEWMRMIQNENSYSDSITSIKGLKDFYSANSHKGALDPSDINFDGIEILGMRNGEEVIYMSCSIDRDNLDHMFRHSKFNLVLDTIAFFPYRCHLPNFSANGIHKVEAIRPGSGGNGFSFDERKNLSVGIDFSLYSSWINEAIQVHKDVELGNFKFTINIPDTTFYNYSRNEILAKSKKISNPVERDQYLADNLISVSGDCFVVPRSYMPLDNGNPMWGTGEYNIKVKVRESCQFADNSEKGKRWREDYKRLRQMQNRSGEVQEYFKTLWSQYGNKLVKTSYSTALGVISKQLTGSGKSVAKGVMSSASMQGGAKQTPSATLPDPGVKDESGSTHVNEKGASINGNSETH